MSCNGKILDFLHIVFYSGEKKHNRLPWHHLRTWRDRPPETGNIELCSTSRTLVHSTSHNFFPGHDFISLPMINLFRTAEFGEKENQLNQSSPARANRNRFRCLLHCRFCQDQSWHPKKKHGDYWQYHPATTSFGCRKLIEHQEPWNMFPCFTSQPSSFIVSRFFGKTFRKLDRDAKCRCRCHPSAGVLRTFGRKMCTCFRCAHSKKNTGNTSNHTLHNYFASLHPGKLTLLLSRCFPFSKQHFRVPCHFCWLRSWPIQYVSWHDVMAPIRKYICFKVR